MNRRSVLCFWVLFSLLAAGCVKRMPVSVGGDRTLKAGEGAVFGEKAEVPEGTKIVWTMGDGAELRGPQVEHAWHVPGTYTVGVEVTDQDGQKRSGSATITVSQVGLLEILPATVEALFLFDRPPEQMKELPVLLERLLPSGKDANAVLASIQENLGFDPLSEGGMRTAGLDPEGGLAWVSLRAEKGMANAAVATIHEVEAARETFRRILDKMGEVKEQTSASDPAIMEMRRGEKDELVAASTVYRGHLWVGFNDPGGPDPVAALAALRSGQGGNLAGSAHYQKAAAVRKETGAGHLFMSKWYLDHAQEEQAGKPATGEEKIKDEVLDRLEYFRADLDLLSDKMQIRSWTGLSGEEAAIVAKMFKARNQVPAFGTLVTDKEHLVMKLSVNLPGFWKAVLDLAGQGALWTDLIGSLEQLGAGTGIQVKAGLLDNVGDNHLLLVRLNPVGLLDVASRGDQAKSGPMDLFSAVVFSQLRNPDLFVKTLDKLAALPPVTAMLNKSKGGSPNTFEIQLGLLPLTMVVDKGFAVLATSAGLAKQSVGRIGASQDAAAGWPKIMDSDDHQVALMQVNRFIEDFKQAEVPRDNPGAAFMKSMAMMVLGKLSAISTATLDAALAGDALAINLTLAAK
ncbi:PKD domain-containing protein [Myxococcota bacterium]